MGDAGDPFAVTCGYEQKRSRSKSLSGNLELSIKNLNANNPTTIEIRDNAYGERTRRISLKAGQADSLVLNLKKNTGWYDVTLSSPEHPGFLARYAGRSEEPTSELQSLMRISYAVFG